MNAMSQKVFVRKRNWGELPQAPRARDSGAFVGYETETARAQRMPGGQYSVARIV